MLPAIHSYIRQRYVLNTTALAYMRIALSVVLLVDLYYRFANHGAFYSVEGLWPPQFAKTHAPPGSWSIYLLFPSDLFFTIGCAVHALLLIALLVGWRTVYITPLVWFMCYHLQQRNTYVNQGGDSLALIVLLCACFLPWGERYSMDERHQRSSLNFTAAHLIFILSIMLVYTFTVFHKQAPEWRWDGSAITKTLQLHQLRSSAGEWLLHYHSLSQMLTWLVLAAEALIPLFLALPVFSKQARMGAFFLITVLNLGFAIFLRVGLFPFVNIAIALSLLPLKNDQVNKSKDSPFATLIAAAIFLLSFAVNLTTLPQWPLQLREPLSFLANVSGLNQNWGMFSPGIIRTDGWYTSKLLLKDGSYQTIPNELTRSSVEAPLLNDRWRKFGENLQKPGCSFLTTAYCYYILRKHNGNTPKAHAIMHFLYFHPLQYKTDGSYDLAPAILTSACHE